MSHIENFLLYATVGMRMVIYCTGNWYNIPAHDLTGFVTETFEKNAEVCIHKIKEYPHSRT
jgi:hypothetical protein